MTRCRPTPAPLVAEREPRRPGGAVQAVALVALVAERAVALAERAALLVELAE